MFVYCGNNPANGFDPSGCRFVYSDERRYGNGSTEYTDTGTGTPYIYSQNSENVANKSVGISTVKHSECGPVATYNASVSLGASPNIDNILSYYNVFHTLLGGLAGIFPSEVISYFENQGYTVCVSDTPDGIAIISAAADTCILWYLYTTEEFPGFGGHYIQYDRLGNEYIARNVYTNDSCILLSHPEDFVTIGNHFYGLCIGIYRP